MHNQSVWSRTMRAFLIAGIVAFIFIGLARCGTAPGVSNTPAKASGTDAQTLTDAVPATTAANLDDDATQWGIFYDGGTAMATLQNVAKPSVDGKSLQVSLISGQPYVGIHAYRNLSPADTATSFDLTLSFYFPDATHIQALEFTMSKWVNNQRWEWAMQWERIGSGVTTPVWRLWTGSSWQSIGVTQQLAASKWHKLHIKGNISNGVVHYISFKCDTISANLSQTFAPVSNSGDKLAVAVQLDGDSQEDPYQIYIDQVSLQWS